MRIYKMTATFGKLEHETLTLEPGLNVIEAPNEWGKSTWCAFLITMLYGLDTRAKSTKTALADKERYAPWSGSPMAGRIDLNWKGRDITIERSTKGRTQFGVFRAYETQTGLALPELTAANCGQTLLGVEQSVFRRTGFLRQSDMPITQDDALRRRLNALVTTGDETGDSDKLETELKNLKNKCRYNRSGLLPQAEAQGQELEDRITELETLEIHSRKLKERLGELKSWLRELENHRDALLYAAAEKDAVAVAEARDDCDRKEEAASRLEQLCARQPSAAEVEGKIRAIEAYRKDLVEHQLQEAQASACPQPPVPPAVFRDMTLERAADMVSADIRRYELLTRTKPYLVFLILAWAFLLFCIPAAGMRANLAAGFCAVVGLVLLVLGIRKQRAWHQEAKTLEEKYGSAIPELWQQRLKTYEAERAAYDHQMLDYRVNRGDLDIRATFLEKQRESLFGGQEPEKILEVWRSMAKNWQARDVAFREWQQAEKHLQALQAMAKPLTPKPAMADSLAYTAPETERLLAEALAEQQRLQNRLGQYQGRMEALGDMGALQSQLQGVQQRIEKLEEFYGAAVLALDTLAQAKQELQRRFAPRISKRAQELLGQMTAGRYDRLSFNEDLSLLAAAEQEETLHEALWRSDGTVDQLYFALRLAVAEELIPEAPVVLDDAFVRFDDARLKEALHILKQEAKNKQVILFTCQHREKEILG